MNPVLYPEKMTAELRTRCGCTQLIRVPFPFPDIWQVAIQADYKTTRVAEQVKEPVNHVRTFKYVEASHDGPYAFLAHYYEVL